MADAGGEGKVATLVESVAKIADAFDRLVRLAEDWSDAMGVPQIAETDEDNEEEGTT